MHQHRTALFGLAAALAVPSLAMAQTPAFDLPTDLLPDDPLESLIGDDYVATIVNPGGSFPTNDTALLGPDLVGHWFGVIGYDVEATTIHVESLLDAGTWGNDQLFDFSDLDPGGAIIGATVIAAGGAGWSLIDDSDVTFTATSVTIDAGEIDDAAAALDQFVTIEIRYVPAPGAAALLALGGLAGARRRR